MKLEDLVLWARWDRALEHFDSGNREPLADLLREGVQIPEYVRAPLAEIISGVRRPKRGKGRQRLTPEARITISRYQLPYYALRISVDHGMYTAEELAGTRAEYRARLNSLKARGVEAASEATGIPKETVRKEWDAQIKKQLQQLKRSRLERLAAKNRLW